MRELVSDAAGQPSVLEWDWRRGSAAGAHSISDRWNDTFAAHHLPWSVVVDDTAAGRTRGKHRCSLRELDGMSVVRCSCDPVSGYRSRGHIAATAADFIGVILILQGQQVIEQMDSAVSLVEGDIAIWDSSIPGRFAIGSAVTKIALRFSRDFWKAIGVRTSAPFKLDPTAPSTALTRAFLLAFADTSEGLDHASRSAAIGATRDLIRAAVRSETVSLPEAAQRSLYVRMIKYIEDCRDPGALTAQSLAAAFNISERSVHRVFSSSNDRAGDAIRGRRLAKAKQEIWSTSQSLSRIAHDNGFSDLSHLTRSFKAMYGFPPSQLRNTKNAQEN
ncbi:helix-turn-helix domain-containing protein [Pseudonocardia kujensis]|uniref:helix-turn-helix domain-containing protein n=1 Tax=Pseudonocardia kujensis TaxID=1128675 RepID=UPI001E516213|nr:helix-turn-helix domain-containing protein [Pseudonocardia kujensis]MCE0764091.1 helix-turn-helix domain-containing protein [Pseudonocardia kujensis]